MRLNLKLSLLGCALAGAMVPLSATAADLNNPYIHRESSGSWTNVEYNDGSCHYYYARNSYDGETKLNKYGNCSQVAIGPNGAPMPLYATPYAAVPYAAVPYGAAVPMYAPAYAPQPYYDDED